MVGNPNRDPMTFYKKYAIPTKYSIKYSRARALARFYKQEWEFTDESWYKIWCDSGVIDHMGRKPWHYCMVRVDRTEAHGPHNCIIVPRRMHFKKIFHEFALNNGEVDYEPLKHGFYVPPETKQRHKK